MHARIGLSQQLLAFYGYQLHASGCADEATRIVVEAFQRHFRPQRVDGLIDNSTYETLCALVNR